MSYDSNNVFARILRGEIPAHTVYEDEHTLAFMDVTLRTKGGGKVVATGTHCKFLPNSQTSSKL